MTEIARWSLGYARRGVLAVGQLSRVRIVVIEKMAGSSDNSYRKGRCVGSLGCENHCGHARGL